eukprot:SAG11_NODE_34709_length_270_cov_1.087719_1_plen_38_part_10
MLFSCMRVITGRTTTEYDRSRPITTSTKHGCSLHADVA